MAGTFWLAAGCWQAFGDKNPDVAIEEAKRKIVARLAMIETLRPLETIQPADAREQAARVRDWYYRTFAAAAP